MTYNFDHIPERRKSDSIKWNKYDADVLPLWVADMDFKSPEAVIRALRQRAAHGVFGYPRGGHGDYDELNELSELILKWLYQRYGWEIDPDALMFLPGVVTGLNMACHTLAENGGGVLVQPPVYPPILTAPQNAGMLREEAGLVRSGDGSYIVDLDAFEEAISEKTRLYILCNPHNPVGKVFSEEELARIAQICIQHGVIICSDEIHCDLLYSQSHHTPIACLDEEVAQNTITLMSPTKTFNIAGLRLSFAIIPNPDLRKRFHKAQKGLVGGLNIMGIVAATAAYRDGEEWLKEVLAYLEANRNYLFDYVLNSLEGITMAKPEGTYLAWLDCTSAEIHGKASDFFLNGARVALNEGESFGKGGEGFVRLNFGCSRSMLEEALERMRAALEKKRG